MYWYSDDRSVQVNLNREKSGWNRAFYGHWSSPVFLTNILKYMLDLQLTVDRSVQVNLNREKNGPNRAFYGHWSSPVFLTNILKYMLDLQLTAK